MGKAIATNKIGGDLYAAGDLVPNAAGTGVWEDIAAPNNTTLTSGEFLLAQTMGSTEIKLIAGTDGLVTGGANVVTVAIVTSPTSGGTFNDTIYSKALPTGTTYAAGDVIASYIPQREISECYAKMTVVVATDNLSAYDLTAYQVAV